MKSMSKFTSGIVILILLFSLSGCGGNVNTGILTVSAAASLKTSLEEVGQAYAAERPGSPVVFNFGASGSLQQQIEQGAAVDVFIPAAEKQMDILEKEGLLADNTRTDLLENRIVLIVPENSPGIRNFTGLTSERIKKIALGEPDSVPAGTYAREVLVSFKVFESIKTKLVYGSDVRQVLTWVETGNADAGLVYETDAKTSERVKIAATAPGDSHEPVVYPAAVIKASKNINEAEKFMEFLTGEKSKTIFEKHGFLFIAETNSDTGSDK